MASIQWVYANGSQWVVLDKSAQFSIEQLWSRNSSSWIRCNTFSAAVYVDVSQMALICNGYSYTILRRCS
jgi:hypothetical protein